MQKIKTFFLNCYHQLVTMDDSPHSVALGFGIGVFLGIFPFTGAVAAVSLAVIFKFNKASALLGSVITNAWLSIVTFVIAVKIGCFILRIDPQAILNAAQEIVFKFSWSKLVETTTLEILYPLFLGYLIVGGVCGMCSYWLVLFILRNRR